MPMVTVRYWAAAKQAAGMAEEKISAETLAELIAAVVERREVAAPAGLAPVGAQALAAVLARSSFLVDGEPAGTRAPELVPLGESAVVEVLPPFAGG